MVKELAPRIQKRSDHNVNIYAMSGLGNSRPINFEGVPVYGRSSLGGQNGFNDLDPLYQLTDSDLLLFAMDTWVYSNQIGNLKAPFCSYAPVDHSPIPQVWINVAQNALKIIPYCDFGKRQFENAGYW